jgi:hypothetical protein
MVKIGLDKVDKRGYKRTEANEPNKGESYGNFDRKDESGRWIPSPYQTGRWYDVH